MARFQCKCGEILFNSMAPNDIELRVYTDKEWDSIINQDTIDPINIPDPKYQVWRCPKCERLYVFNWGYGPPIKVYTLEK